MNRELAQAVQLLSALAELQKWETQNLHWMRGASGRQLYYGLIRHLSEDSEALRVESMKDIYADDGIQLTERGVRLTIRAFEADGAILIDPSTDDKRSRRIRITEKMQSQMLEHAQIMKKALSDKFMLVEK